MFKRLLPPALLAALAVVPATAGAQAADGDRDGYNDSVDACPTISSRINNGCPAGRNPAAEQLVEMVLESVADATAEGSTELRAAGIAGLRAGKPSVIVHSHYPGAWKQEVLQGRTLLARGTKSFSEVDAGIVRLRPTSRGKAILATATRLSVTVRTTFTPRGLGPIVRSKRVTIVRK